MRTQKGLCVSDTMAVDSLPGFWFAVSVDRGRQPCTNAYCLPRELPSGTNNVILNQSERARLLCVTMHHFCCAHGRRASDLIVHDARNAV